MNDRELLELAAKAAGFDDGTWDETTKTICTAKLKGLRCFWDPLTNDGDALRLAVKLQIQITPGVYNKNEFSAYSSRSTEAHERYSSMQDENAATRRAIVRAAAEIGKGLA